MTPGPFVLVREPPGDAPRPLAKVDEFGVEPREGDIIELEDGERLRILRRELLANRLTVRLIVEALG